MDTSEERLGFLVTDVARLLRQAFTQQLQADAGTGLTVAQVRALVQLARQEGLRQVDLAEHLDIQPITLARLLDSLQEEGLIERRADPHDRRAYQLYLTAAATPYLEEVRRHGEFLQQAALRGLDATQVAVLYSALIQMRANLAQMRHHSREDVS